MMQFEKLKLPPHPTSCQFLSFLLICNWSEFQILEISFSILKWFMSSQRFEMNVSFCNFQTLRRASSIIIYFWFFSCLQRGCLYYCIFFSRSFRVTCGLPIILLFLPKFLLEPTTWPKILGSLPFERTTYRWYIRYLAASFLGRD